MKSFDKLLSKFGCGTTEIVKRSDAAGFALLPRAGSSNARSLSSTVTAASRSPTLKPASTLPLFRSLSEGSQEDNTTYTDLRNLLDMPVVSTAATVCYPEDEAGAEATAQSERIKAWSAANRFQAVSQASMMSARLRNTELASQWLRR